MKKKKGFTLVELLAVIVILAVILIIAVPKITDVIKNAKKSSMEDASKLIATQAEKQWLINQTLSPSDPGYVDLNSSDACSKVSKYNSSDYDSCSLRVNDNGEITSFNMTGKGKFAGLKCTGTSSSNITCTESDTNLPEYVYSFKELKRLIYDVGSGCMDFARSGGLSEAEATKYCNKEEAHKIVSIQQQIHIGSADMLANTNVITNVVIDGDTITSYDVGSRCMDYAQKTIGLSQTEATKYCNKEEVQVIGSIQQDILNVSTLYNLIDSNAIVPEYEVGSGCMDYAQNEIGLSQTEATKYCNKEEVIDPNSIISIQRDIDRGDADWLIENNAITNVVRDGDTITSWEVGEGCMDFAMDGGLSQTEATKYCNKEEVALVLSIQRDIDRGDADWFIENNVIKNVVKNGDTITSWEVGEGCIDFAQNTIMPILSKMEATKFCNKEEVTPVASIQKSINLAGIYYLIQNNVVVLQYEKDYSVGEEDYTKVKDLDNNQAQVFIRYKTQDDSKAVCTLYGGDMHCFEVTSSAFQDNSNALQTLFDSNKCNTVVDGGVDYTLCADSGWYCDVRQNGSVGCGEPGSDGDAWNECYVDIDGTFSCVIKYGNI